MSPAEAIARVRALRDNLVGAKGQVQRKDRAALDVLMAMAVITPEQTGCPHCGRRPITIRPDEVRAGLRLNTGPGGEPLNGGFFTER